jgi:hypothetical protein
MQWGAAMSYSIDYYDEHNPQMRIAVGDREISFSLMGVQPDSRDWLGRVLDREISEMVELRVREALEAHKKALRDLLGVRP